MDRPESEYVECRGCGFTLLAEDKTSTEPRRWDSCPECGGTEFEREGT